MSPCRTEEALRLLLDRREAELREAMKLRHSLTTLLHMLRNNMVQVRKTTVHSLERCPLLVSLNCAPKIYTLLVTSEYELCILGCII